MAITDPSHPIFDGVSTVDNWGNTAHSYIDTYPSDWVVVATDASGNANTLVFDDAGMVNEGPLRFPDECVRHKVIDLIGDLALLDAPLQAFVTANKAGHRLHHALVREIDSRRR